MKKCPYCGKEYPDDSMAKYCSLDQTQLTGGHKAKEPPETHLSEMPLAAKIVCGILLVVLIVIFWNVDPKTNSFPARLVNFFIRHH